jgi:hypothetical protein
MYMTMMIDPVPPILPSDHCIAYSTSWVTDGVNWSAPQCLPLPEAAWLPSATIVGGQVRLFYNSGVSGNVRWVSLGSSGVSVGTPSTVALPSGKAYANVDVMYRPSLGLFQIFAEVMPAATIDYLYSDSGSTWTLGAEDIAPKSPGFIQVRTPAPHPDTHSYLFYGQGPNAGSTANKIFFRQWL